MFAGNALQKFVDVRVKSVLSSEQSICPPNNVFKIYVLNGTKGSVSRLFAGAYVS